MHFVTKTTLAAIVLLLSPSCATQSAQQAVAVDPMPPMPAEIRALWDNGREHECGRLTSPRSRSLEPDGQRLMREGRRGWVVVRITVGTNGTVTRSDVVASAPQGLFDHAALTLLGTNTYPPRRDECTTVDVLWLGSPHQ